MRIADLITALCLILFTSMAQAQTIPLKDLSQDDYKRLVGDFSAASVHTSVSGAGTLGHIFGFEIGLVGGMTNTPEINKLVHQADPGSDAPRVPHGEILGVVTVPFGITIEAGLIPKVGSSDFKFNSMNLAAKWTFSDLLELPLDLAVKAQVAKSHLEFDATIQSVPTHFDYTNTITGFQLLASKDLGLLEPYFGLGTLSAAGKMNVNGSSSVFSDPEFSASQSASAKKSSMMWMLGTEVKLVVVKLGVEYARLYGTNSYTGKLSFYF